MREIKFRAWCKKRKMIIHWEQLLYEDTSRGEYLHRALTDDNYIIMQFTGLLDKNGKEIYEGDIVRLHCFNHNLITATIEWLGYGRAEFYPRIHKKEITVDGGSHHGLKVRMSEVHSWAGMHNCFSFDLYTEVIGNIYEHGHLLESRFPNSKNL